MCKGPEPMTKTRTIHFGMHISSITPATNSCHPVSVVHDVESH